MGKKNRQAKQAMTAADIAAQSQAAEEAEVQQAFEQGITTLRDLISPSSIEIHSSYFRLGTKYMFMVILARFILVGFPA